MRQDIRLHVNTLTLILVKLEKTSGKKKLVLDVGTTMTNVAKETTVNVFTEWRFYVDGVVWVGFKYLNEIVTASDIVLLK